MMNLKKKKHKIVINRKYNKKNINNLNIQEFMEQVKKKITENTNRQ